MRKSTRRLYTREAMPSMFAYATEVLHLSEAEAYLRIAGARVSRQFPVVLEMLEDGRLHLTAISMIAQYLNEENASDVLKRAVHRTKRELQELVAELAPKPDVPTTIRKLPAPIQSQVPTAPPERPGAQLRPDGVELLPHSDAVESTLPPGTPAAPSTVTPAQHNRSLHPGSKTDARVEPLAPARYRVQFTASAGFREKLERLEARRRAKVKRPRKSVEESDTSAGSRYVPAAVRRTVVERDQERCTFVGSDGRRCPATEWLELHHDDPVRQGRRPLAREHPAPLPGPQPAPGRA